VKKKQWKKVLLALICLWSIVTVYFYFQHRVTGKVMEVPAWSLDDQENQGLLVREIRVYDWELRRTEYWDRWFPVLSLGNKLPPAIRMKYFGIVGSILTFYTDRYQKLEEGIKRIEVIGIFLNRQSGELDPKDHPKVRVYSDDNLVAGISSGFGMQYSSDSNYYTFNLHDDMVYKPITNSVKITWQWGDWPVVSKTLTNAQFNTKTHTFFSPPSLNYRSNLRPDRKALEFIYGYKNGEEEKASVLLSTQVTGFPWNRLDWTKEDEDYLFSGSANYFGEYKGFQNVFAVDITIQEADSEKSYAKQRMYLVDESLGKWKVIDIDPLKSI